MSTRARIVINTPTEETPRTPHADERNINDPGTPVGQVAFDMKMKEVQSEITAINRRIDHSYLLIIGLLAVLAICFITLFFEYQPFKTEAINEYNQKSKELNDDRYDLMKEKYELLEEKIASQSGN